MKKQPNIIFIFSDQQHWQAANFSDPGFATPNLNTLAADGHVFTHAFCTTPQCSPSRSSLLTGLYPSKTGVLGNVGAAGGEPLSIPTIAPALKNAGYQTAYFGKWHLGKNPAGIEGWDGELGVSGPDIIDDQKVTQEALSYIARMADSETPHALFLSYNNPHDIYQFSDSADTIPRERNRFPLPDSWKHKDLSKVPTVQKQFMRDDQGAVIVDAPPPAWQHYRELYREKTECYDVELGKVLRMIKEHALYDESLIIATSDHGDMDTHHGLIFKGPFMYEQMMRVPLIIKAPKSDCSPPAPREIDVSTINVDIAPTLLDYAQALPRASDGISLRPFVCGDGAVRPREYVIGQYYSKQSWVNPIRMIRGSTYKYNEYLGQGEELYDLHNDPGEMKNLTGSSEHFEVRQRLRRLLKQWILDNDDPFYSQQATQISGAAL